MCPVWDSSQRLLPAYRVSPGSRDRAARACPGGAARGTAGRARETYLGASRREGGGEAALPAVPPAAQQALLGARPLPRPLHQALALLQPLQVLLVLLELLGQLPAAPPQQLLPRLAGPLALLQPALPGLLLPPLPVAPALPVPLLLLELQPQPGRVGQLLAPPLQAAVLKGAASESRARGQALLRPEQQPVDRDVAVLDGQGGLWGRGGRGGVRVVRTLGWNDLATQKA